MMSIRNGEKAMYGRQRKQTIARRARTRALTAGTPTVRQEAAGRVSFACRDAGDADCDWQASAANHAALLNKVREHARDKHDLTTMSAQRRTELQKKFKVAG
jgi:predicted small metal-binding protein